MPMASVWRGMIPKAVECFRKGAENGFSQGPVPAGGGIFRGLGVEQSDEEAARWYQSAAWLGYPGGADRTGALPGVRHRPAPRVSSRR